MRHAIASFCVHNTPQAIASIIIPEDEARNAPKLRRGEVLFHSLGTTTKGNVVKVEPGDAERFVNLYNPEIIDADVVYESARYA